MNNNKKMNLQQKIAKERQKLSRDKNGKFNKKRDPFLLWGEYPHGWEMIKDLILCFLLLNILIGQIKQIDISQFTGSRTVIIVNEAKAKEKEVSNVLEIEKTPQIAEFGEIGEFSGYTASKDETDDNPTLMASGKKVYIGSIACPNGYEFGDKIKIENMGIYTCEDRMNARYRDKQNFDIYFESYDEAIKFGRKELKFKKI